ncbi:acyl carrier protein [Nocardia sp. NPDC059764]|uniref:acyl carrier protein n=1 Tax=Nocardia sp. NPDC059764 TaxID=3346939 RepID=UPI0036567EDA
MHREQEIRSWFIDTIAEMLDVRPAEIDIAVPFAELGLTSLQGVRMASELSEWLGVRVPVGVVFDYPTIELMAHYLSNGPADGEAGATDEPDPHDPSFDESMAELLRLLDADVQPHGETE